MPQSRATMKYVRTSPRKMRRVVDLIRGEHVEEARRILRFSGLGASNDIAKLLNSAIANAEQNPGVIAENLVVARGWVDRNRLLNASYRVVEAFFGVFKFKLLGAKEKIIARRST